ncbi:hypothetical protein HPS54_12345 [Prevotella sp. PCHR]|uniref:Uncharacterized protein n=2 Tax=Xylanibacter caecicola TaxID=2736294 RepID=A0ABX2B8F3_9BACT|nr:HAD domain-containing protein [Xylanibacter caecicola]NPE26285.1 hypothetical protein [Xylanibacter caecicola]
MKNTVIFLDFDGVMDNAYYDSVRMSKGLSGYDRFGAIFDPRCVHNLKYIIDKTGADIVVSSSWKEDMSLSEILEMWTVRNLPGRVIDTTPIISCYHRGDEIDVWLEKNWVCRDYVIIDDLDAQNFNEHHISHLFLVNPYIGLDEGTTRRIVEYLMR